MKQTHNVRWTVFYVIQGNIICQWNKLVHKSQIGSHTSAEKEKAGCDKNQTAVAYFKLCVDFCAVLIDSDRQNLTVDE